MTTKTKKLLISAACLDACRFSNLFVGRAVKYITQAPPLSVRDQHLAVLFIDTMQSSCSTLEEISLKKERLTYLLQLVTGDINNYYHWIIANSITYITQVLSLYDDDQYIRYYKKLGRTLQPWSQ